MALLPSDLMYVAFISLIFSWQIGLITGMSLAAILGFSFGSLATLFTRDTDVLEIVRTGVLVCKRYIDLRFSALTFYQVMTHYLS